MVGIDHGAIKVELVLGYITIVAAFIRAIDPSQS